MRRRNLDELFYTINDTVERIELEDALKKERELFEEHDENLVLDALEENHSTFNAIQKYTKLNLDELSDAIARLTQNFGLQSRKISGTEGNDREYFLTRI